MYIHMLRNDDPKINELYESGVLEEAILNTNDKIIKSIKINENMQFHYDQIFLVHIERNIATICNLILNKLNFEFVIAHYDAGISISDDMTSLEWDRMYCIKPTLYGDGIVNMCPLDLKPNNIIQLPKQI